MEYNETEALADKGDLLLKQSKRFRGAEQIGLCGRCTKAHIFRVKHKNDPFIVCGVLEKQVTGEITDCNKFQNEGTLSIWDLASLAKVIDNRDKYQGDYR